MVKITNGINVFEVPSGAAKAYEASGYHIVSGHDNVDKVIIEDEVAEVVEDVANDTNDDNRFVEDIMEKPVSQWNGEEIRRYASSKGIDLTGVRTTKQARSAVIAYNNEVERKASIG